MMSVCGGSTPTIPEACSQWCCTEVKASKISYAWTIKNFSLCTQKTGQCLNSSTFFVDDHEWRLELYPRGLEEEDKDYLALFLRLLSCDKSPVSAKWEFSILNANQSKRNLRSSEEPDLFIKGSSCWGFDTIINRKETKDLSVEDQLTLVCDISIVGGTVCTSGQSHCKPVQVPESRLSEELGQLCESSSSSDVTLCVGEHELRVHKYILKARSPVFSAMFQHEMNENITNCVDITDVDHEVMREIITFIYTDRAPNLDKMPFKLLAAADKYDLKRLKAMCEKALCSDLKVDNACQILVFGDLHSADQLKSRAIDFISNHATAVMNSAGWKEIFPTHPQLVAEAFRALASQQSPSGCPPCKRMKLA